MRSQTYIRLCMAPHILAIILYSTNAPLYSIRNKGLTVIQQRYCADAKMTYLGRIDPWLVDKLYLHKNFQKFFNERSGECVKSLYQTVTMQQMMWGLKMEPLPRERWEPVLIEG